MNNRADKLPTGPTVAWTPPETEDIKDLLYCISKFDDKPHHLFSSLRRLASHHAKPEDLEEMHRLMDVGYFNAWKIFKK